MNMFLHELWANRKSTMIWTISIILISALYMSFYPSFAKDAEEFRRIMAGFPAPVRDLLGLNLSNLFTILGYYSFTLTFITLCGAIQAMNLGTSIISKEVREKTADFLLTKPVSRTAVITAKLLAALTSLFITNIVYLVFAMVMAFQVKTDDFSYSVLIKLSLTVLFIQLIFLALGFLISVIVPKLKSVLPVSLGTVFAFYFLGMFSDEASKRFLSPFKYFDYKYIIKHGSYEAAFLITIGVFFIASIMASYLIYKKKDIHSV
ncbi:ABC transporter permease subunit [Bacillus tuaregi]|uniref:ABC transporter permease subunit n=1 Tax=Bacillus tuaregi TaxID=1816695 RepID=UPI0008F9049E|nr:ABC transporter permease subunit [Bacillus tuaregi]